MEKTKTFRFYHFIRTEYVESFLRSGQLKVTQLGHSNDYFEYKPGFTDSNVEHDWNLSIKGNEPCVVCLSAKMSSPVMWGHYGERGKGVCLVFDLPLLGRTDMRCSFFDNNKEFFAYTIAGLFLPIVKISYDNQRIIIPRVPEFSSAEMAGLLAEIASSKPRDWQYEQEYRVIVDANRLVAKNGCFFYSDLFQYCSAVLLGWDCPVSNAYLSAILRETSRPNIRIVNTYPSLNRFEICSCVCNGELYKDTSVCELDGWGG